MYTYQNSPRTTLLISFYNHGSSDNLHLHSFPTRRSSDLTGRPSRRRARGRAGPPRLQSPRLDRKSTRLNSSHTVISYAVFCLKKKKRFECDHLRVETIDI